jgi:hydroxypyruvate isomerase
MIDTGMKISRRSALKLAGAAAALPAASDSARAAGRIKQSVARWCYSKFSLEDLAKEAARIGLKGIDLIEPPDWPVAQKYGLVPAMSPGGGSIADGWNRRENHDKLVEQFRDKIDRAAKAGVPNVIALSGNRKGMSDAEGMDNVVAGLSKIKPLAEDKGVTICLELLNSKVNHKDYMCDHTAWGVEVIKRLNSRRMKLLYDIYHMQIMEGDVIRTIKENIQYIGHFHTGGVPGRHELDATQELNYRPICEAIAAAGFTGYMAHEFVPVRDPMRSLEEAFHLCDV